MRPDTPRSATSSPDLSYAWAIIDGTGRQVLVAVDCAEPALLARFWADALDYRVEDPPSGYRSWSEFSRAVGDAGEEWSAVVDPAL